MKTLGNILMSVAIGGALAVATLAAQANPKETSPATQANGEVKCKVMANLTKGSAKGPQWIQCTPALLKKDRQCQIACGQYPPPASEAPAKRR